MTEAQEIIILKKKLEDKTVQYYRVFDENRGMKAELNEIKRMAERNSRGWYTEYLQSSLADIERQYEDLQENFHKLSAKHAHEMSKRQYIFPNNASKSSTVEVHYDHTESEQI